MGRRPAPSRTDHGLRARSIVAVAHAARLIQPLPGVAGPGSVIGVTVVDDGGEPWVLLPPWEQPPSGEARLHIGPGPGERSAAGAVLLAGRFAPGTVAPPGRLPDPLRAALERHRGCLDVGQWPALAVARISVSSIGLAEPDVPVPGVAGLGLLTPVTLTEYAAVEPDLWQIQQRSVLAHLNDHHADLLLAIARRHGAGYAAVAAAQTVDPLGVTLAVVGPDGGDHVRVPFRRRLQSPAEVGAELAATYER